MPHHDAQTALSILTMQALREAADQWGLRIPDTVLLVPVRGRCSDDAGSFIAYADAPIYDGNGAGIGGWVVRLIRIDEDTAVELSVLHGRLICRVNFGCELA